MYFSEIVMSA